MMGLGLYEPPPMPQAPVVGHEWSPQPTADSSVPDILAQIEAARRWFGGNKGEEHHTRMNFDNNVRGISSPYARGLWL